MGKQNTPDAMSWPCSSCMIVGSDESARALESFGTTMRLMAEQDITQVCEGVLAAEVVIKSQVIDAAKRIIYEHLFDHLDKCHLDVLARVLKYAKESNTGAK